MFFWQAEGGIRDLVRSRGIGDVYKRQGEDRGDPEQVEAHSRQISQTARDTTRVLDEIVWACLLYTSDAADERSSVDLGGRSIIKTKTRPGLGSYSNLTTYPDDPVVDHGDGTITTATIRT